MLIHWCDRDTGPAVLSVLVCMAYSEQDIRPSAVLTGTDMDYFSMEHHGHRQHWCMSSSGQWSQHHMHRSAAWHSTAARQHSRGTAPTGHITVVGHSPTTRYSTAHSCAQFLDFGFFGFFTDFRIFKFQEKAQKIQKILKFKNPVSIRAVP